MSRTRRLVFVTTLVAAVYLVITPFALSLFSRTNDAEQLSDYYRPLFSAHGVAQFRLGLKIVGAGGNELYEKFLPQVQHDLGMSEPEFNAFVAQNFPHVAAFLTRAPKVVAYLKPASTQVLAQQANFKPADDFPFENLPVSIGPWALLALGLGLGGVALVIRRGNARWPVIFVAVIGLGLVTGPAILGWFHATDAAEQIAEAARGPFTAKLAATTLDDTYKFDAAFKEMRLAMFPAVGKALDKTPAEMHTYLYGNFPATMKFLDTWDKTTYRRALPLALSQTRFRDEFNNADATPYKALPWIFMAPGAILLLGGGYALWMERKRAAAASSG
jgi:hypothetical protein